MTIQKNEKNGLVGCSSKRYSAERWDTIWHVSWVLSIAWTDWNRTQPKQEVEQRVCFNATQRYTRGNGQKNVYLISTGTNKKQMCHQIAPPWKPICYSWRAREGGRKHVLKNWDAVNQETPRTFDIWKLRAREASAASLCFKLACPRCMISPWGTLLLFEVDSNPIAKKNLEDSSVNFRSCAATHTEQRITREAPTTHTELIQGTIPWNLFWLSASAWTQNIISSRSCCQFLCSSLPKCVDVEKSYWSLDKHFNDKAFYEGTGLPVACALIVCRNLFLPEGFLVSHVTHFSTWGFGTYPACLTRPCQDLGWPCWPRWTQAAILILCDRAARINCSHPKCQQSPLPLWNIYSHEALISCQLIEQCFGTWVRLKWIWHATSCNAVEFALRWLAINWWHGKQKSISWRRLENKGLMFSRSFGVDIRSTQTTGEPTVARETEIKIRAFVVSHFLTKTSGIHVGCNHISHWSCFLGSKVGCLF